MVEQNVGHWARLDKTNFNFMQNSLCKKLNFSIIYKFIDVVYEKTSYEDIIFVN